MKKIFLLASFILCAGVANAQDTAAKKQPVVLYLIKADPPPGSVKGASVGDPKQYNTAAMPEYPHFPGGPDSLRKFVKANFKLPQNPPSHDLEVITFYVETDGTLSEIHVTRGLSPELDKEAIRVMSLSPKWQPALKDGKPNRTLFSIPVRFPL